VLFEFIKIQFAVVSAFPVSLWHLCTVCHDMQA